MKLKNSLVNNRLPSFRWTAYDPTKYCFDQDKKVDSCFEMAFLQNLSTAQSQ